MVICGRTCWFVSKLCVNILHVKCTGSSQDGHVGLWANCVWISCTSSAQGHLRTDKLVCEQIVCEYPARQVHRVISGRLAGKASRKAWSVAKLETLSVGTNPWTSHVQYPGDWGRWGVERSRGWWSPLKDQKVPWANSETVSKAPVGRILRD